MSYIKGFKCGECRREYLVNRIHVCEFRFGPLEVIYDYGKVKNDLTRESMEERPMSMWRHPQFLPSNGIHGIGGLEQIKTAIRFGIYDSSILDGTFFVKTEDAYETAVRPATEEWLLVDPSSGRLSGPR